MKQFKTLEEIAVFLKDIDSPLGDLCSDILQDPTFPLNDDEKSLQKIKDLAQRYEHIKLPASQLLTIYKTINKQ